jgi:hypothetical protein
MFPIWSALPRFHWRPVVQIVARCSAHRSGAIMGEDLGEPIRPTAPFATSDTLGRSSGQRRADQAPSAVLRNFFTECEPVHTLKPGL